MRRFSLNISVALILVTVVVVLWFGFRFTANSSAGSPKIQLPTNTEAMNITRLNALLESDSVRVDDAALLPAQTERSQTIFVRLKSETGNSADGLSPQMPETVGVFLLKVKSETGALSRQRSVELSPNQILVVAVNAQKQVLWWNLQPDPRVFRAETSDDTGQLSGKTLYRHETEMLVSLPADAAISEVRFYHPVWDGVGNYSLKKIGNMNLR